jgi:hypothetical protein
MKPANLLILMSDEHNPKVMGCAGHALVKTPHLDALAARVQRFFAQSQRKGGGRLEPARALRGQLSPARESALRGRAGEKERWN